MHKASLALAALVMIMPSGICQQSISLHNQMDLPRPVAVQQSVGTVTQPSVSAEFVPEITTLASQGLVLKEAREIQLGSGSLALAAVFEKKHPADPRESYEFRIIESFNHSARTVFRRTEFFFTMLASPAIAALNGTDINADGFKEVIVQSSSGGNCWGCNPTEIYSVAAGKAELIAAGPIRKIEDLDGDGKAELLVTDARWEMYGGLPHAASPWSTIIYSWRNGRYEVASGDFPRFYDSEIARIRAQLDEAKSMITSEDSSDDTYIGLALALAVTYADMGQLEHGLEILKDLLSADVKSQEQSKRRNAILEDFQHGESFKKLKAIKPGDPLL